MMRVFLLGAFLALEAQALVNLQNASFTDRWVDYIDESGFQLERLYHSRSLHNGIFGFGWCSPLETALVQHSSNSISIKRCHQAPQLFHLISKVRGQKVYRRKNTNETISFFKNHYHFRSMREKMHFNIFGQLTLIKNKGQPATQLKYQGKQLIGVILQNKRQLDFKFRKNTSQLKKILNNGKALVTYTYEKQLSKVQNAWNHTYRYIYNNIRNLEKIQYPDGTKKEISYDNDRDIVSSLKHRNGCIEHYSYRLQNQRVLKDYISSAVKFCRGKVVNSSFYHFIHQLGRNGRYLASVKASRPGFFLEVTYDASTGHIRTVQDANTATTLSYASTGKLIQAKISGLTLDLSKTNWTESEKSAYAEFQLLMKKLKQL